MSHREQAHCRKDQIIRDVKPTAVGARLGKVNGDTVEEILRIVAR
jgi:hypothetical protein